MSSTKKPTDTLPEGMQFNLLETPEETAAKLQAAAEQEKLKEEKNKRDKEWNEERRKALKADRVSGNKQTKKGAPDWYQNY